MRLSDTIESFIKELLGESEEDGVELKRNELAEYFQCAPSQINYVLSTRFTPDHGYMIESRRGGGGCIRIVHVQRSQSDFLDYLIRERVGASLADKDAQLLTRQLVESGTITREDGLMIAAALSPQALAVPVPEAVKSTLRARILRSMLLNIARRNQRVKQSAATALIRIEHT